MSLERTALRLAAVMALANGFAEPYPTMARQLVYDSRIDPIQGVDRDELVPTIRIMTETDQGQSLSANNGGPPFERRVFLIIEISLGTLGENAEDGLIWPETEPELEAMLDLFERQVERVFLDGHSTWGAQLSKLCRRIEKWDSERFIEREGNTRFAARQITAVIALPLAEDPQVTLWSGEQPSAPAATIPAPLGPLLDLIVADEGSYAPSAQAMKDMLIAAGGEKPFVLPRLERVRFIEADHGGGNADGDDPARLDGIAESDLPTD